MGCLKLATLLALPLAFALTLGAAPQQAAAGLCTQLGKSNGCVNNKDVQNNKLKANDMKDEGGGDFASKPSVVQITMANENILTVSITAPRAGLVIVNASAWFSLETGTVGTGSCSITTGNTVDADHEIVGHVELNDVIINPWGATRGFNVLAGTTDFNLVCSESGNVFVGDPHMTALYVPTQY